MGKVATALVLLTCLCGITYLEAFPHLIGQDQFVRLIGSNFYSKNGFKELEASFGQSADGRAGPPSGPPSGPPPNGAPRGPPPPGLQQRGPPGIGGQRRGQPPNPTNATATASG